MLKFKLLSARNNKPAMATVDKPSPSFKSVMVNDSSYPNCCNTELKFSSVVFVNL